MTDKPAPSPIPQAPRYKQGLVTWLGVYPGLTLHHADLRDPAFLNRVFRRWMFPSG